MAESLLSSSSILIFGRILDDLVLNPTAVVDNDSFISKQLSSDDARFARIYGYSFEGQYVDIIPPAIFLVHGDGDVPEGVEGTGLAFTDDTFSPDIRSWSYDQSDFSIRLDSLTGPFEDILLSVDTGPSYMPFGGQQARGQQARGQQARGQQARGQQARGQQARGNVTRGD